MGLRIRPETRNVIQLGLGFFFVFVAANSQGFIAEPVITSISRRSESMHVYAGYYAMAIMSFVYTFANFISAPIVDILSARWAMTVAALCYVFFECGFFFMNQTLLYASAVVQGVGGAIIYTGYGNYLAKNSNEKTAQRNAAILVAIVQSSMVGSGLLLTFVFSQIQETEYSDTTIRILYACFIASTMIGVVILAVLPTPPFHLTHQDSLHLAKTNYVDLLLSTFRLFITKRFLLLTATFCYLGIELSFYSAIYPTAISFTEKLGMDTRTVLAINAIMMGLGDVVAGLLFWVLGVRFAHFLTRSHILFLGLILHLLVFAGVYVNFPADSSLMRTTEISIISPSVAIALVCGFMLGFGDACWSTQLFSLMVTTCPEQSSQAFAIYSFFLSGLSCASFFYSTLLNLHFHLAILTVFALVGAFCFFLVDRDVKKATKKELQEQISHQEGVHVIQVAYDNPLDQKADEED